MDKLDKAVDEIRSSLAFAIQGLQLKDNQRLINGVDDIKLGVELIRTDQISAEVLNWLKAPDVVVNHYAACAKRSLQSGDWLVESVQFTRWLTDKSSFLWLNGFAGTGKSFLCSTAIEYLFGRRKSNPRIGIAFFYFTFNDESKQNESVMLRALLLQLSCQLEDGHSDLSRLYESYKTSVPPSAVLIDQLHRLIQKFSHIYVVLDALDESPRSEVREYVLDNVETMRKWSLPGLHLLVTSRDETDIRTHLNPSLDQEVRMKNAGIDKDIADFISNRLRDDRQLQRWSLWRDKIREALVTGANGV